MPPEIIVVLIGVISTGFFLIGVVWFLRKIATAAVEEAKQKFGDLDRLTWEKSANYFGNDGLPAYELRGNGVLVLGPRELWFRMWAPNRTVSIPTSQITRAFSKKSHKGKSRMVELLAVSFKTTDGEEATIAWHVRDVGRWLEALEAISSQPNE